MRIAVWHDLPSGGGKRALNLHVEGLIQRGHHVELWSPPTASLDFLPLGDGVVQHVLPLATSPVSRGGRMVRLTRPYRSMRSRLAAMEEHCRQCAEDIDAGGFDVLLGHPCRFFRATPIGELSALPSVLYLQEPFRILYEAMPRLPWLARPPVARPWAPGNLKAAIRDQIRVNSLRLRAREELRSVLGFDQVLVNSLFSRESVLRTYGVEAEVCYLGIDTERFRELGRPRGDHVLGVGALVPEKRVDFVLRATARVAPSPPVRWIANYVHEPYLKEVQALAAELGVDFRALVSVSDETLLEELNTARLMVYAPRLEPFGYAPLEANACGLPVLAVAEGGVRETVEDGVSGRVVRPGLDEVAEAIGELLGRDDEWAALSTGGRQAVMGRWSATSATERLEAALERTVASSLRVRPST